MLELSTRYAIKALMYLAELDTEQFTDVKSLSQKTMIPGPYLSKLMKILSTKGIVEAKRGRLGGVRLPSSNAPSSFLDICAALEDPIVNQHCFLSKDARDSKNQCLMHKHWMEMKEQIISFLQDKKIT